MGLKPIKILIVASDKGGKFSPFVEEQIVVLQNYSLHVERYAHTAHGIPQYLKEVGRLRQTIKTTKPDIVHAHFGLSGLVATLAALGLNIPVVVTYHGCDINDTKIRPFSQLAMRLAAWNIFVSHRQMINAFGTERKSKRSNKWCIMPCGINIHTFDNTCVDTEWFRQKYNTKKCVLFAGSFMSEVKNPELAKEAIKLYNNNHPQQPAELLELRGYTRNEVAILMSKCQALLLTSIREGSPQVVKEAMACGCPIVSVDVGDVAERLDGVEGCKVVASRDPKDLAKALEYAITHGRTQGRDKLLADGLDNAQIAQKLIDIYTKLIKK